MQADSEQIYDLLMKGDEVEIRLLSIHLYSNLRTLLVKRHTQFRAVGITADSLCSDWLEEQKIGKFWIGKPRKRAGATFEIVSHGPLRDSLDTDTQERESSNSSLPSTSAGETDTSDSATEIQSQRTS